LSYLVIAYAFAVLVLGGYLGWSLRRLRQLEARGHREPQAQRPGSWGLKGNRSER
jgi:heme exporter protein CcmD